MEEEKEALGEKLFNALKWSHADLHPWWIWSSEFPLSRELWFMSPGIPPIGVSAMGHGGHFSHPSLYLACPSNLPFPGGWAGVVSPTYLLFPPESL